MNKVATLNHPVMNLMSSIKIETQNAVTATAAIRSLPEDNAVKLTMGVNINGRVYTVDSVPLSLLDMRFNDYAKELLNAVLRKGIDELMAQVLAKPLFGLRSKIRAAVRTRR